MGCVWGVSGWIVSGFLGVSVWMLVGFSISLPLSQAGV